MNRRPTPVYEEERVACPLCGSLRHAVYLQQAKELYNGLDAWFDVVCCRDCGHYFTNPRPTAMTIGSFYPDSAQYYKPKPERISAGRSGSRRWHRAALARHFGYPFPRLPSLIDFLPCLWLRRRHLVAHVPRFVEDGRLLDIGCAWGGYLARMRELGWEVCGVELNDAAARYARETLGLDVRAGSVEELNTLDGNFDVIHMSMVLEHLYDPLGALKNINRLLKSEGQLILSVPDISGFEARVFGRKAYTLQVPQHLQHFTPESITLCLKQAGFCVERIVHQKTKSDILKSAAYFDSRGLHLLLGNPMVKGLILSTLTAILARFGKSSRMSVFAAKCRGGGAGE